MITPGQPAPQLAALPAVGPGQVSPVGSAAWLNQIIAAHSAVRMAHGINGIQVAVAANGIIVALDPTLKKKIDGMIPGSGGGSISFLKEWNPATEYAAGDVVIATGSALLAAGKGGTYISLQDSNTGNSLPAYEDIDNAWWYTLARGHFEEMVFRDSADSTGYLIIVGGRIVGQAGPAGPKLDFTDQHPSYSATLNGKTFRPQVLDVCEDGVWKKIGVLATDTWEP